MKVLLPQYWRITNTGIHPTDIFHAFIFQVFIRFASRQTENREDLSEDNGDIGDGEKDDNAVKVWEYFAESDVGVRVRCSAGSARGFVTRGGGMLRIRENTLQISEWRRKRKEVRRWVDSATVLPPSGSWAVDQPRFARASTYRAGWLQSACLPNAERDRRRDGGWAIVDYEIIHSGRAYVVKLWRIFASVRRIWGEAPGRHSQPLCCGQMFIWQFSQCNAHLSQGGHWITTYLVYECLSITNDIT